MAKRTEEKLIANNKKAYHDYFIEDSYEAGISLSGTEVKSMRMGKCSLKEAYVRIENGEAMIYGMHITPYEHGTLFNKDPLRTRRLLLHKYEITKLANKVKLQGLTVIPLKMYLKDGKAKLEVALARGKTLYDKREDDKLKSMKKEALKAMRRF